MGFKLSIAALTSFFAAVIFQSTGFGQSSNQLTDESRTHTDLVEETPVVDEKPEYEDRQLQKVYERIHKKLGKMKREDSKERSEEDLFVVGTALVHAKTAHADVCFQTLQSQKLAARRIVDFVSQPHQGEYFRWQVFGRAESTEGANQILASIRAQYDQAEAYLQALMNQYKASTIRRC